VNILFLGAHHDDLEVSVGGSVARWSAEGHRVYSAILTDSIWTGPDGSTYRTAADVERYTNASAQLLGYTPVSLNAAPCLQLRPCDEFVVMVLRVMARYAIDTLVTICPQDAHPDHRATAEIGLNASRRIPRVLLTRVSWNCFPGAFDPRYYHDITGYLPRKLQALKCFEDEYARTGVHWETFARSSAELYGLAAGCTHAEGFEIVRFRV
jgi:LmbE family N-acetylglucosaminyl deacetylase